MESKNNNCESEKPKTPIEWLKSKAFRKVALAVIAGGIGGYFYYYYVGCASGTCAITSNPVMSIIFGASIGLFLVNRPCSSC